MDLSALIFVALAIAWAAYLVPKALKHHDDMQQSRSVERFSERMRVLARRQPVSRGSGRLVVTPFHQVTPPRVETKMSGSTVAAGIPRPKVGAARRRRRVLGALLLVLAIFAGLVVAQVVTWPWVVVPGVLVVAWLVACRMAARGRAIDGVRRSVPASAPAADSGSMPASSPARAPLTDERGGLADAARSEAVGADPAELATGSWDMVPVTLPTYVDAPPAVARTVRTIDLESTGVWSSGRSERDSELAREAEEADRVERERARARRASGA